MMLEHLPHNPERIGFVSFPREAPEYAGYKVKGEKSGS
jgi:hypothetical protein